MLPELADLFYNEFRKIHSSSNGVNERIMALYERLNRLFLELTRTEKMPFATAFARIAFVCHKHNVRSGLQWRIYQFRKRRRKAQLSAEELPEKEYLISLKTACFAVSALCQFPVPDDLRDYFLPENEDENPRYNLNLKETIPYMRVMVLDCNPDREWLLCQRADAPSDDPIRVRYNEPSVNSMYNNTINLLRDDFGYKASMNLIDVLVSEEGVYYPKAFVLEPDYLIDVSGIAECFQGEMALPHTAVLRKFMPKAHSLSLSTGNIANHFLDELMNNIDTDFTKTFPKVFQTDPLAFVLFNDNEVRDLHRTALHHFTHLQRIIKHVFPERGISPDSAFLEPSFYSEKYGIQGRLDIWQPPSIKPKRDATIVELKSGKPFKPNQYNISNNHYVQTTLYDLLVQSVFQLGKEPTKYILYSGLDTDHLKFAPTLKNIQDQAIQIRNELIAIEYRLATLDSRSYEDFNFIDLVAPDRLPKLSGFSLEHVVDFAKTVQQARPIERRYFFSMISFIAREHHLSRTGIEGNENANGQASLWLDHWKDKEETFELLNYLVICENHASEDRPHLMFERTEKTNKLANFRVGDMVVVYPFHDDENTVLDTQIFKGNIESIGTQKIKVGFKHKQFNPELFDQNAYWRIEPDSMDIGFNNQYQSLYAFLQSQQAKRDVLLTTVPPRRPAAPPETLQVHSSRELNAEQIRILQRILSSPDYFLLVGPPGTGKTKFMLAELAYHLLHQSNENLLLMAYTNRAVDEICDAIEECGIKDFIRVGSRSSTEARFHSHLLSVQTEKLTKRQELKDLIGRHRIFVATVASAANNAHLFKIKTFDTAIIDEASQILEPQLIGILPRLGRFVLIGDHKQLPAVVQQPKERSREKDEQLNEIGIYDRRNSLFERLYQRAQKCDWHWVTDMLQQQGRMHGDIMAFPSQCFYGGKLTLLADDSPWGKWQREKLTLTAPADASDLMRKLAKHRVLFLPARAETAAANRKINRDEARQTAEVVKAFQQLYKANDKPLNPETIGVITPFRAQIAQIRQEITQQCGEEIADCTIDTVERYQGGAREIIIISLCMNTIYQMEMIVSLSDDEQVDRKLNVALTRARQHLVIIGNENLMRTDRRYAQMLDFIEDQMFRNR